MIGRLHRKGQTKPQNVYILTITESWDYHRQFIINDKKMPVLADTAYYARLHKTLVKREEADVGIG